MRTLILKNIWGGLGDHLFYSHLPRIAKETGACERVLISNRSSFRDPDYRRLIWETNPFVDGFTDADGLCPVFERVPEGMNLLDYTMLQFGLDDRVRGHEPEIYYQPTIRPELADKTLFDPNFVSGVGEVRSERIDRFLARESWRVDLQFAPRSTSVTLPRLPEISTPTIFDYCNAIASCRSFVCLTSGGATLAAALRKSAIAFYGLGQNPMFRHSKLHRYVYAGPHCGWALTAGRKARRIIHRLTSAGPAADKP